MPPPAPISHSPTLPRLSPADHTLFNLFAASHLDLHALADKSGRDLTELTAWAAAPEIRLYIEAYREIAGHALLNAATSALLESIRLTSDPIEKRRAATALLRAHTAKPRSSAAAPSSPSGGGGPALRAGGGSVSTPPTKPPSATAPLQPERPPLPDSRPVLAGPPLRGGTPSLSESTNPTPRPPRSAAPPPAIAHQSHLRTVERDPSPAAILSSLESLRSSIPGREARTGIARLTSSAGLAGPAP